MPDPFDDLIPVTDKVVPMHRRKPKKDTGANGRADGHGGWKDLLLRGDSGPRPCEANVEIALLHAPELKAKVRHDAFRGVTQVKGVPWSDGAEWRDVTDHDVTELGIWLQHQGVGIRPDRAGAVLHAVARKNEAHPVRDYLLGLEWDLEPRINTWLHRYLGCIATDAQHDAYLQSVGRAFMVGAVARVMHPGCKVDTALILEGSTGIGKSSAARALCGPQWFADEVAQLGSRDAAQDLRGKWMVELAELSAMARSEIETVKAFMSRAVDHYRPSYGRVSIDVPRQCVFVGSTNKDEYLKDETGNRRFWPVPVGRVDLQTLGMHRDQLWAEAVALYRDGARWWLTDQEEPMAAKEQAERMESDPWESLIRNHVAMRASVTTADILAGPLDIPKERWGQREQKRVAAALKMLGWKRSKAPARPGSSVRENVYVRG